MIDMEQYSYEAILQAMLDRVPDTYDKRDTAPIPTALGPAAYGLQGFYLELYKVQNSAFIQTAQGQDLDYLAVVAGLTRYPASAAVRLGIFNAPVPVGARFSTINGEQSINFVVTGAADGADRYRLTAETPGAIGNDYVGPILPITTIPGLTSAQITDILVPGDETETDNAFRERIILALNERPFGGNIASYREAILGIDGVGAVQVYPTWNGGGTVKCSVLGADFLPASAALVEKIQNSIDPPPGQGLGLGTAPIGAQVTIGAPVSLAVNAAAKVTLAAGYTLGQVEPVAKQAIADYLLGIRQAWGNQLGVTSVEYAADVYIARVTAAIVNTPGVVNAANIRLNGGTTDLILTETGALQQVPVLGTVTLSV